MYTRSNKLAFIAFARDKCKKSPKHLHNSKKNSTFAGKFEKNIKSL